jgi:hypothetical protein
VRRFLSCCVAAATALAAGSPGAFAQAPPSASPSTDLDRFMVEALVRRDIDRKTLSDYVLDEVESIEVLGPGRTPLARLRRDYTWFVRDGFHIRSPLKADGVPITESERRAYEDRWQRSEESRRTFRTKREEKRAAEGRGPAVSVPSIHEPRFVSESYFLDFKFEPGNYYLAGRESIDGKDVLRIDYLPTRMFDDDGKDAKDTTKDTKEAKERKARESKERDLEQDIERKMNKSSQVTLWVDPASHQIVKYTFDNVWLDFLPGAWLVRVDDLRASMEMGQPFPGVWLPRGMMIHAGVTFALGPVEVTYKREFSNYRRADVMTKVTVPRKDRR